MKSILEQYLLTGSDLDMPLVDHCGFEQAFGVRPLSSHSHRGPELVFLIEGEMLWKFSDGKTFLQQGGMLHVLGPGVAHAPDHARQTPCRQAWIVFAPLSDVVTERTVFHLSDLESAYQILSRFSGECRRMSPLLLNAVQNFAGLAKICKQQPDFRHFSLIRAAICRILLLATQELEDSANDRESQIISQIKAYIEKNLDRNLSMDELVREIGYSGTWFLKVFRHKVGVPPAQYLRRRRIEKARQLLLDSRLTITEIAFECGFGTSQHFSQVFKKYTGHTPSEIRKK